MDEVEEQEFETVPVVEPDSSAYEASMTPDSVIPDEDEEETLDDLLEEIAVEGQPWEVTHYIGETPVMRRAYSTGLTYFISREGKKRRPTPHTPLRAFRPAPPPAVSMDLDRDAFILCCEALGSVEDRAENGWNVAERIDDEHVRLTLADGKTSARYVVRIPEAITVIGSPAD